MIGQRVGRYEILARLGAGGMGVVYSARDIALDRLVALKFLPRELADPEARERFVREARAASALDHPAICTIFEIGETEHGAPFLAMAHYEGESLRERLARGALPVGEALAVAGEVADGLAAAHARGIVHRDIKPANLFLTREGRVKILDFGLAHRAGSERLTGTGMMIGTPPYMAPEQLQGGEIDARTDLWALGVVLYECLTGRRPFGGGSNVELYQAIVAAAPEPPSVHRPEVASELDALVLRLLTGEPARRSGSAATLLAELRALQGSPAPVLLRSDAMRVLVAEAPTLTAPEHLEAYEHCARGLEAIFEMSSGGFARAAEAFALALAIDPEYAMAHSGLGQMLAMRYISTTDRGDLEAAIVHLERATALDPELADPHLWLTYALARLDRFEEAVREGRRAVEIEPANALARYFLAVAIWLKASLVGADDAEWREAAGEIARSTELAPRNQSAFLVQADIYCRAGQYRAALAAAGRAAEIERSGDFENARFVGGQATLATVLARSGETAAAEGMVQAALRQLESDPHVYAPMFTGSARCLEAELLFRRREYSAALSLLRRAREEAERHRRSLAVGWPRVRIELRLSAAFGRLHLVREQRAAFAAAMELLESRAGFDFSGAWGGGEGEMRLEVADTRALAGDRDGAFDELELAVAAGFREGARLATAPGLSILAGEPRLEAIRERLARLPPLPEPLPSASLPATGRSAG